MKNLKNLTHHLLSSSLLFSAMFAPVQADELIDSYDRQARQQFSYGAVTKQHSRSNALFQTKSTSFKSASALIADVNFVDPNLAACVNDNAADRGWTQVNQVTELYCNNRQINDLAGLSDFSALYALALNGNQIGHVDELASLINLQYLYLSNNYLNGLYPLNGLNKLRVLTAENNEISSLEGLSGLTNLNSLHLSNNSIIDLSPLANNNALEYLLLDGNDIIQLSALSGLTGLKTLFLHNNQISHVGALSPLVNINRLNLSNNAISDISVVANMAVMEWLLVSNNQVSDISALNGLNAMTVVDLNLNQISDLTPLSNKTTIEVLYLGFNQISDISPLYSTQNIVTLLLNDNAITEVKGFLWTFQLKTVYLQYNQLVHFDGLNHTIQPEFINISANPTMPCRVVEVNRDRYADGVLIEPTVCAPQMLLSDVYFPDWEFAACVNNTANNIGAIYTHQITDLDCGGLLIGDISGTEYLEDIQTLDIRATGVFDTYPLRFATHLTHLNMAHTNIEGFEDVFDNLLSLQYFDLEGAEYINCDETDRLLTILPLLIITSSKCYPLP